jgi:hypothetical protein
MSFWLAKRRPSGTGLVQHVTPAVSIWCASGIFLLLADTHQLLNQPNGLNWLIVAVALFTVIFSL